MSELAEQYQENEKRINEIREERDTISKEANKEIYIVKYGVYARKIRALQDERDKIIQAVQLEEDQKIAEKDKEIQKLHVLVAQVDRILSFLKVKPKDLAITDTEVKAYDDKHSESLGYIINDEMLKVKLFIVENRKPKNKFSLLAFGRCTFSKELCELPYGYGLDSLEHGWFSLKKHIVDRPSIQELKDYLQRRRKIILSSLLGKSAEVKRDYLQVTATYKLEDFEALTKYRCSCGYFYTSRELRHTSIRDGVKCPKCGEPMTESTVKAPLPL